MPVDQSEERAGGAKSVFHFDVPGSVAKSTHAGLPWVQRLLGEACVHVWPLHGWRVPAGRSVMAEIYPSMWREHYDRRGRTADQHDSFVVASRLRDLDGDGRLPQLLEPKLSPLERDLGRFEGWILGA